ncbi:MAG: GntR family transcriptional regulator [Acidobacteria bacterium RIFCSPLOWO2_02_FULL_65_29]|nr:MAG: GntR family transcriptional regulator [Acidobacteria bacterium RIFCSPLOWO2_02_FULL_65_29]
MRRRKTKYEPARRSRRAPREGLAEDAIYDRLLAAIFEHRLPPGTKLGEDRLAAIYGVSRARIRRVLPRLAHEGVVTLEPNRGAFVAKPTVAEAHAVLETRRVLEPGVVERFVQQPDRKALVARLRQHVAAERRARAASDTRSIVRLSGEFHILLADMAGNLLMAKIMRELCSLTCLIIALYDKPSVPSCLGEEHAEIVEALAAGDGGRATQLMVQHLEHVEENLDLTVVESGPVDLESALD